MNIQPAEPDFSATVLTLVESGLGVSLGPHWVRSSNRPVVIRAITTMSSSRRLPRPIRREPHWH